MEHINRDELLPLLDDIVKTPFFRYFKVRVRQRRASARCLLASLKAGTSWPPPLTRPQVQGLRVRPFGTPRAR